MWLQISLLNLLITLVFVGTFIGMLSDRLNKTLLVLLGAGCTLFLAILPGSNEATGGYLVPNSEFLFSMIDMDLIMLIVGMSLIVGIARENGFFDYVTIIVLKKAGINQLTLYIALCCLTMVFAAFFDAFTTIIIITSVTLVACQALEINPKPYILIEILLSNLGQSYDRITSVPNIILATYFKLNFIDFFVLTAPYVIVATVLVMTALYYLFKKDLSQTISKNQYRKILLIDPEIVIKDHKSFNITLVVMTCVLLGFVLSSFLPLSIEMGYIALAGGFILTGLTKTDIDDALKIVNWSMIFFVIGVLLLLGITESVGSLGGVYDLTKELLANGILGTFGLEVIVASTSAFLDNVLLASLMTEIIEDILLADPTLTLAPILMTIVIGINVGDNLIPVTSTGVIHVVEEVKKANESACPSTKEFLKYGFIATAIQLVTGFVYIAILWLI